MKEIDFLPEWYKTGARKLSSYQTLSVAVVCIFLLVVASSFVTGWMVSKARAELNQIQTFTAVGSEASKEFSDVKSELDRLQSQIRILERLDSKIVASDVLGELSFLIDKKIVLEKVRIGAEPLGQPLSTRAGTMPRAVGSSGGPGGLLEGDVRFKVIINGLASGAADVARLVRSLEESPYFRRVIPHVSGNKSIKGYRVNEFEISCYVANYTER